MNERTTSFFLGVAVGVGLMAVITGQTGLPFSSFNGAFDWLNSYLPSGMANAARGVAIGLMWAAFGVGVWIVFRLFGRAVGNVKRNLDD